MQLYSRDVGKREAKLGFDVGQGTQDLGFRNEVDDPVRVRAGRAGEARRCSTTTAQPTTGQFVVSRHAGPRLSRRGRGGWPPTSSSTTRSIAPTAKRCCCRRASTKSTYTRGPEYLHLKQIDHRARTRPSITKSFRLKRWIKLADLGWYSGDHHVHAAGCAHYEAPTEGVTPADMMRHILGEDLNVGCVLSWGPCWYYQKQYFEGKVHKLSTTDYLMRYDVEVSGFPSSHAGHLCLLRLKEDDYEYPRHGVRLSFAAERALQGTKTSRSTNGRAGTCRC